MSKNAALLALVITLIVIFFAGPVKHLGNMFPDLPTKKRPPIAGFNDDFASVMDARTDFQISERVLPVIRI